VRDLQKIAVARGVVHLVAPRSAGLVLSEGELPLGGGVADFLAGHVDQGLRDPQASAANFAVHDEDRAFGLCDRLLAPEPPIIEISQRLATQLYGIMQRDERVSDGTFAVLLCDAVEAGGTQQRFVALVKLDPSEAYRTVEGMDPAGRQILRLEVESDILPTVRERLQKCAFVCPADPALEYRMLVVDRQRGPGVVSRFFIADFLGAESFLDPAERTARLYRSLRQARNEVADELDAGELVALDDIIGGTVVTRSVNLDDLVGALPLREEVRQRIDEIVSRSLPDRQFDLDREVVQRFVRRRTFEGDNGLRLSVPAEFFEQMISPADAPGTDPGLRRFIIETRKWKEI
jgi:hypothetical protein